MLPCVTVLGGTFAKIVSKMLLNFESSDHGRGFFLFVVFFEAVEVLPNILFSPFLQPHTPHPSHHPHHQNAALVSRLDLSAAERQPAAYRGILKGYKHFFGSLNQI